MLSSGGFTLQLTSNSMQETRALGAALAKKLRKGDVVLLDGQMGAGKSEFARGIAQGLSIADNVTSPTFTILQVYNDGIMPLYHFDWYRITDASQLYEMGMDEYLYGDGIAVVEWPQQCEELIPDNHLSVKIDIGDNENQRIFTFTCAGSFTELFFGGI